MSFALDRPSFAQAKGFGRTAPGGPIKRGRARGFAGHSFFGSTFRVDEEKMAISRDLATAVAVQESRHERQQRYELPWKRTARRA